VRTRLAGEGARVEYWQAPGQRHGFFNRSSRQRVLLKKADIFLSSLGLLEGCTDNSPEPDGGMQLILMPSPRH
jgi:hypothetical protein